MFALLDKQRSFVMFFPLKDPSTSELTLRLKKNVNVIRERAWTTYVNVVCKVAHVPNSKVEAVCTEKGLELYDRKFFLMQGNILTTVDLEKKLEKNYGYFYDIPTGALYLMIPSDSTIFQVVSDSKAIRSISAIIAKKDDASREAMWEEMDAILEAFSEDEWHERPEFLSKTKSISYRRDGKFCSAVHAPNGYAFKRHTFNSFSSQVKVENLFRKMDQRNHGHLHEEKAEILLNQSWFSRAKENFSWSPLVDWYSPPSDATFFCVTPHLSKYNRMAVSVDCLEKELNTKPVDIEVVKKRLFALRDILDKDGEGRNVFIDLLVALGGVVSAPIALLIGLIWVIPAYCLNLPYFGQPQFFMDATIWFVDSLMTAVRCLLFPLEMIHAYNTSGSMNILKGECTRIIETLSVRVNELELANSSTLRIEARQA